MEDGDEPIYTHNGKEFSRKYRKFGDICLTEKNERIFVCCTCKKLLASPCQFWRHQNFEHGIRGYENILDNTEKDAAFVEASRSRDSSDSISATAVCKRTRSSDRLQNGVERKLVAEETQLKSTESKTKDHCDDSPLLKKALKKKPKTAKGKAMRTPLFIPRATREELNHVLNANSNDDNFNEFIFYCCPECGKQFQTDAQWKQHTAAAHNFFSPSKLNISLHKVNPDGSTVYKCDICRVLLKKPNIAPLRRHKLTHMPFKSFCCRLCGTKIRHKSGIVHHIRTVHRKGRERFYKCTDCQMLFYTESQYNKHFKKRPGGGLFCTGLDFTTNDSPLTEELNANNTDVNKTAYSNAMSEDGNYDNSFDNPNGSSIEEECDRSEFLNTIKLEPDNVQDEPYMGVYNIDIKEEPPEMIDDIPDDYDELWQGDAALVAEEQLKLKAKASQLLKPSSPSRIEAETDYDEHGPKFECPVCSKNFAINKSLKKHLRTHGKKMDCRHCGVKISSIKALRRHLDLNRCKALNGSWSAAVAVTIANKLKQHEPGDQNEPKEYNDNTLLEDDFRCELCPKEFHTEKKLLLHYSYKHGQKNCRLCGGKISTHSALRRHYNMNRCKALK